MWKTAPASELVPGDLVKLTLGGVVTADVKLTGGEVLLDQSMLTGIPKVEIRLLKQMKSSKAKPPKLGDPARGYPALSDAPGEFVKQT